MIYNSIEKQFRLDYNNIIISLIDSMGYDIDYKTEEQLLDVKVTAKNNIKLSIIESIE
tara:strand:- start:588 stop:761 length:174 start_codon:yes stop_codon:yes gene_type:complete